MSIDKEQVKKIASLAKLSLSEEELESHAENLNKILEYVETLEKLPTQGVEPITGPLDLKQVIRADECDPSSKQLLESMINNFPDKEEVQEGIGIKVPKMMGA
ncbi:MAG: Asp-tRNA(Asn)/Glu-tRNA(Gln) amidotransferase subunit GatC [Candidatus Caenarcaniphilales bacterium]|nr:Asp-tRNA(Asn)/Glu-tRNA(Gln) amidotransferase subunit GatC [Candidatus Caenarcaniphilales bacterium]